MKKYLLSISILIVLILGSSIFLPYIFKDQIIAEIKKEANNYLKLELDFSPKIGINIFKSFPDLNLTLNEVELIYSESNFSKDTFLTMDKLEVSFDLMRFYKNQEYIFNSIEVSKPNLYLESSDSADNWDIVNEISESDEDNLVFHLSHLGISDGKFTYKDESNFVSIIGIDHTSTGIYDSELFKMKSESHADNLFSSSAGITYINHWELNQSGDVTIDLGNNTYAFEKNSMTINGLPVSMDGTVKVESENLKFDAKASSISSNIQSFLTLIPSVYTSDYENIENRPKVAVIDFG
ncbi:MAG: AsmA family protein, partial [Bacteroidia bacterium]